MLDFIGTKEKREKLVFIGGGLIVVAGALWTAFVSYVPPQSELASADRDQRSAITRTTP